MNDIICRATAGTLESSDVFVTLEPHDGLQIDIDSVVKNQHWTASSVRGWKQLSSAGKENDHATLDVVFTGQHAQYHC